MATEISLYPPFSNRITVGRNDPCHCLSGKKFKKCCAAKKEAKNEPIAPILTFTNQPIDQHLSYDVPSKADKETLASLYCQIRNHPETIKSVNDDYFTILQELKKKYTNYPAIFNYLALGYQHLGLDEKFKELTFETHAKFPSYLFGLTAIASLYLNEQNPDKALEIFKNAKLLTDIYPTRNIFHVSEGYAFHNTLANYYCQKRDFEKAEEQVKILEKIVKLMDTTDDLVLIDLKIQIMEAKPASTRNNFKLFKLLAKKMLANDPIF